MTKQLILILARSHTKKDFSRQNLRLINDKPLIYYVIQSCINYKKADIYVTTDSAEISDLSKFFGVQTLFRPKELLEENTPINLIIQDALKKLGKNYEKCLVLSPNFPLIKTQTINNFFEYLNSNIQTIFGYEQFKKNDQFFQINQNNTIPKLLQINSNIVKTSKICSFFIKPVQKTGKFLKPSFGIKLDPNEIFHLQSYHSFGTLEKIIKRKRILARVDGSDLIGLGHVYNMLTILNRFREDEILVVMNKKSKLGSEKFKEYLFDVKFFNSTKDFVKIVSEFNPDVIFNDILDTKVSYIKKLKKMKLFVVNFEDLGHGAKYADLIFNPIYNSSKTSSSEFFGSNYACVRDEFRMWPRLKPKKIVSNILIMFGGTDPTNKTIQTLKILEKNSLISIKFTIIIGLGFSKKLSLLKLIEKIRNTGREIELIEKSDYLAKKFLECDFVISSNGRTIFELASICKPVISVSINKRESRHSFIKDVKGGYLINSNNFDKQFVTYLNKIMLYSNRKKFFMNFEKINVRKGIDNVIEIFENNYDEWKRKQSS